MIVIGSAHSSNTTKLLDICKGRCARTFLVNSGTEVRSLIQNGEILSTDKVGITAGASTPEAIILEVVQQMNEEEKITNQGFDTEFANAAPGRFLRFHRLLMRLSQLSHITSLAQELRWNS